jgi:hypothetical protein
MSSHREAPQISKDPTADSTDVYAFVSPDDPSTVTLIANYVPLEHPDGGPNFYEFDDAVMYDINVDNNGDGLAEIQFQFYFDTQNTIPTSFLYNDGPITSISGKGAALWNRKQFLTCVRHEYDAAKSHKLVKSTVLVDHEPTAPCNIGPLSTPNYASLAAEAVHINGRTKIFAGQRAEGFYVDLGAVFDLGDLRPFEQDHFPQGFLKQMPGVNSTDKVNVHSLAIQTPISLLTASGNTPTDPTKGESVIGVWTSASRQKVRMYEHTGKDTNTGPWVQVSRLGNPLINELLIPLGYKDYWNTVRPVHDSQFAKYIVKPLLADLLPLLYSADGAGKDSVFPNLMAFNNGTSTADKDGRLDLLAILMIGVPPGIVAPTFSTYPKNFVSVTDYLTKSTIADQLRLNLAIKPVAPGDSGYSNLGVLGNDVGGFPNGRRVSDDVATIELRAVAGATLPLINSLTKNNYKADTAAGEVTFGLTSGSGDSTANNTEAYLKLFPYLGTPHQGYNVGTSAPVTS